MRLSSRQQNEYYNFGKQAFAFSLVFIGFLDLLFQSEQEFKCNFLFWKQLGFWESTGLQTAQKQSLFFIFSTIFSMLTIAAGILVFFKDNYGPISCATVLFFKCLMFCIPVALEGGKGEIGREAINNLSIFLVLFAGCLLILSRGNDEHKKSVSIDSPLKHFKRRAQQKEE